LESRNLVETNNMRAEDSHVVVFLLGLWNDRWVAGWLGCEWGCGCGFGFVWVC